MFTDRVNSPLGKYGQLVAAALAVVIVLAWIVAEFIHGLRIMATQPAGLKEVALIAVGAVFGAAATVNGVKGDIMAADSKAEIAHARLDAAGAPHLGTTTCPEPGCVLTAGHAGEHHGMTHDG
jgi:hypothetical protein